METARISAILDQVLADGRDTLIETEGLRVLHALGLSIPAFLFVTASEPITEAALASLPGDRVVVKVISPRILHKSDVGGVAIVEKTPARVAATIADMHARLGLQDVTGYSLNEYVPYSSALGHEIIVGVRRTDDLGPVVSVGAGGIYTEFLSGHFKPGHDIAVFSPARETSESIAAALDEVAVVQLMTRSHRGQPPRLAVEALARVVLAP